MFWFQKESQDPPCPVGYALSLTESFLNSIHKTTRRSYDVEKALIAGWLNAGAGNDSLSGHADTALRPALHMEAAGTLIPMRPGGGWMLHSWLSILISSCSRSTNYFSRSSKLPSF